MKKVIRVLSALMVATVVFAFLRGGVPAKAAVNVTPLDPTLSVRLFVDDGPGGGQGDYVTVASEGGQLVVRDSSGQVVPVTPVVSTFLVVPLPAGFWSQISFVEGKDDYVPIELWGVRDSNGVLLQLGGSGVFSQTMQVVKGYPDNLFNDWAKELRIPAIPCTSTPMDPSLVVRLFVDDGPGGGQGDYVTVASEGGQLVVRDSSGQVVPVTPVVSTFLVVPLPAGFWSQISFVEGKDDYVPIELWGVRDSNGVLLQLGGSGVFSQTMQVVKGYPDNLFNDWAKELRVSASCGVVNRMYLPLIIASQPTAEIGTPPLPPSP